MKKISPLFLCALASLTVSACTFEQPTWTNGDRVEVHQGDFTDTFKTDELDQATLHAIANQYYRYGNGPMNVAVTYNPQSRVNTAPRARSELSRIEKALQSEGVRDLQSSVLSSDNTDDRSTTIVTFAALTAQAPAGCTMMPGYDSPTQVPNSAEKINPDYKLGCSVETLISKQVARPGDLLGRPGFETDADGRRQEKVLNRGYYGTVSNAPLQGPSVTTKQ